jgi:3-dehydroquinate synthase
MTVKTITVDLGERSYPIIIGAGILKNAAQYLRPHLTGSRLAVITDETVAGLHLAQLQEALAELSGIHIETIILPPGEATKSFAVLEDVVDQLLDKNFSRADTLLAFGGGVIGDLTGFIASMLKRGCHFVQMPTTLLAQVDSAVGGKTAINTKGGKNLVGQFYQPNVVLSDCDVLKTLPVRQMKAGYGEVLKYALINDPKFFDWLETHGGDVIACDAEALSHTIAICCRAKADIVRQDEREHGVRALLNLGHSFAHALEGKAGYDGSLLHGEAVTAGMLMAVEFSRSQDMCREEDVTQLAAHLRALDLCDIAGLPAGILSEPTTLMSFMMRDKKNTDGALNLILTHGIGEAFQAFNVRQKDVLHYLTHISEISGDQ